MPTVNEVWEQALQINANLATIHNDLTGLQNCCTATNQQLTGLVQQSDETNDWLEELRQVLADGLATLSAGIAGIHARQEITNQLLAFQAQQQQTIICILENISRNTCGLLNESDRQTGLQRALRAAVDGIEYMYATANPEAGLTFQREQERRAELERCCPPKPAPDRCTYEPCPQPKPFEPERPERYPGYVAVPSRVVRVRRERAPG